MLASPSSEPSFGLLDDDTGLTCHHPSAPPVANRTVLQDTEMHQKGASRVAQVAPDTVRPAIGTENSPPPSACSAQLVQLAHQVQSISSDWDTRNTWNTMRRLAGRKITTGTRTPSSLETPLPTAWTVLYDMLPFTPFPPMSLLVVTLPALAMPDGLPASHPPLMLITSLNRGTEGEPVAV